MAAVIDHDDDDRGASLMASASAAAAIFFATFSVITCLDRQFRANARRREQ